MHWACAVAHLTISVRWYWWQAVLPWRLVKGTRQRISLHQPKCLKFSTFIVFFDFLSTILAPYLCRHIYFYCLYNSTVWYFQIWLKLAFSRRWHVKYPQQGPCCKHLSLHMVLNKLLPHFSWAVTVSTDSFFYYTTLNTNKIHDLQPWNILSLLPVVQFLRFCNAFLKMFTSLLRNSWRDVTSRGGESCSSCWELHGIRCKVTAPPIGDLLPGEKTSGKPLRPM